MPGGKRSQKKSGMVFFDKQSRSGPGFGPERFFRVGFRRTAVEAYFSMPQGKALRAARRSLWTEAQSR